MLFWCDLCTVGCTISAKYTQFYSHVICISCFKQILRHCNTFTSLFLNCNISFYIVNNVVSYFTYLFHWNLLQNLHLIRKLVQNLYQVYPKYCQMWHNTHLWLNILKGTSCQKIQEFEWQGCKVKTSLWSLGWFWDFTYFGVFNN